MYKRLALVAVFVALFSTTVEPIHSQTVGTSAVKPGGPITMAVYYKVPPGKRAEWLDLYKKYHYPVMNHFVSDGMIKSIHIYQRRFAAESPAWDYEVVLVWRDWAAIEEGHVKEPGLIETMYADNMPAYSSADQKRFALTSDVWIDILEEVSPQ
ncbi:MAG: hypothetical protein HIU93_15670 [Acidobacteria bacterium]|nr:hypothetical protein [Acidobacteriota bacterium]